MNRREKNLLLAGLEPATTRYIYIYIYIPFLLSGMLLHPFSFSAEREKSDGCEMSLSMDSWTEEEKEEALGFEFTDHRDETASSVDFTNHGPVLITISDDDDGDDSFAPSSPLIESYPSEQPAADSGESFLRFDFMRLPLFCAHARALAKQACGHDYTVTTGSARHLIKT